MAKMNPVWKQRWLDALRSGDYEQGQGVLRNSSNGFCCLGVLTDLAIKDAGGGWKWDDSVECYLSEDDTAKDREGAYLSQWIMDLTGFHSRHGGTEHSLSLSSMNDSGYTFEEIANVIEENL